MADINILDDILRHRDVSRTFASGGHPHTFIELLGGSLCPVTAFEPDPNTARTSYYYNAFENMLYKLISNPHPYWMRVMNY